MTDVGLTLRRARPGDSRACFDLFWESITDLAVRLGTPWQADPAEVWSRLSPLYDHLAGHAAEWWVADEGDGRVAGYARSIERGGLFELSELFVRPSRQSGGIGRQLLELAFPPGRGEVRAIIATTDVRAQARYYAAGTVTRFPIVAVEGTPAADAPADPTVEAVRATASDIPSLRRIEAAVLEFDRGDEFHWLLSRREAFLYRRDGREIGFAILGADGMGPMAALDAADQPAILLHAEAWAAASGRERMSLEVPMVNEVAMRHLLGRGFRMDQFLTLLMSSRPFGLFDRFIGFAPPFVL